MRYSYCWTLDLVDWAQADEHRYVEVQGVKEDARPWILWIDPQYAPIYPSIHILYINQTEDVGIWISTGTARMLGFKSTSAARERGGTRVTHEKFTSVGERIGGWRGRVRDSLVDATAHRLTGSSVGGIAVGAMGCFIFGLYLRRWLGERKALASQPQRDMIA